MASLLNRREFLATTSGAVAGTLIGQRALSAQPLCSSIAYSSTTADALFPDPTASATLQALAEVAVDAARRAGASYADIRLGERYQFSIDAGLGSLAPITWIESDFLFGIRVVVDHAWAFVHGTSPTVDTLTKAARDAVATARGYARLATAVVEFVPAPAVRGEWDTPVTLDPFTVPFRDQTALLHAYRAAAERVHRAGPGGRGPRFAWTRETRVFGSSEGALTTQVFRRSDPWLYVGADCGMKGVMFPIPQCGPASGGYETVAIRGLQDTIKLQAEEAVRLASLPRRAIDVGKYPVVFDGGTLGATFGRTIGAALEMDRVLGNEADASGGSFLAPPEGWLGTSIVSPLLTVDYHRDLPGIGAVRWDDEGVAAQRYRVIGDGQLLDYHTSRDTATALRSWYDRRGMPLQSHGCAIAPDAGAPVSVRAPHLVIAPGRTSASLDDLCRTIKHGILVRDAWYVLADQQLASASLHFSGIMFEIERGRLIRRIDGNGLQFGTSALWKGLMALGDASTVRENTFTTFKGQPWRHVPHGSNAPAGLFKDVNVVMTKAPL